MRVTLEPIEELASLFAGIGGPDLAGRALGLRTLWTSEVDPNPRSVLVERFPEATHLEDVRDVRGSTVASPQLLTAGSPCQGFSLAGLGNGLEDPRSGLFGEFVRLVDELEPAYALWENVEGALTANEGKDLEHVLAALVGASDPVRLPRAGRGRGGVARGPRGTLAWRVLDATGFGVAARRRRVFALLDTRGGRPWEVLLDAPGARRATGADSPERVADAAAARVGPRPAGFRLRGGKPGGGKGPLLSDDRALTLATGEDQLLLEPVGHAPYGVELDHLPAPQNRTRLEPERATTLLSRDSAGVLLPDGDGEYRLRRYTPVERERLLGFPDGWTEPAGSDAARARCTGNSIAVPVAAWVLARLRAHTEGAAWDELPGVPDVLERLPWVARFVDLP